MSVVLFTAAQIDTMRLMREKGVSFAEIGRLLGCDPETIKARIDPRFAELKRENTRRRRAAERREPVATGKPVVHIVPKWARPSEAEIRAARERIPEDTRDLTGRLFGDPLPGRSALAQRGGQ